MIYESLSSLALLYVLKLVIISIFLVPKPRKYLPLLPQIYR